MESNIKLMIRPPKQWHPDHYQFEKKIDIQEVPYIQEIPFDIGNINSHITEVALIQYKNMIRHMTSPMIAVINRLDNVLFDFHKQHPEMRLRLSSPDLDYYSSNTLKIEMMYGEKSIETEIPFFKIYEDWNSPEYLSMQLERMHEYLKGE